ncbi:flagellar basal body rod protein FlgB [Photobacterium toruni]|uniref:flagellar basal body rod protein FlgB n=1 Tax=Photobacterium toruni TaxID=1935446 RepID=UPI00210F4EB4|nr:flagellar basal body rod protein FlgB [Photobacterium toruni]
MLDSTLGFFSSALAIREQQLSLVSANIANRDTPNYKAQDIEFNEVFNNLLKSNGNNKNIVTDNIKFRDEITPKLDGNTVNDALEASKFSEYTTDYQMALEMLTATRDSRLKVIRGK